MIKSFLKKLPPWLIPLGLGFAAAAALILLTCIASLFSPFRKQTVQTAATPVETEQAVLSYRVTTAPEPETEETDAGSEMQSVTGDGSMVQVFPSAEVILQASSILQLPELPNGCEVTALSIVFAYNGYTAGKVDLANNYLSKSALSTGNPYETFVGNPAELKGGFGCFAPVICNTAERFIKANRIDGLKAVNVSGQSLSDLARQYVKNGIPVVVWGTISMIYRDELIDEWDYNGEHYKWYKWSHCLVLIGYNDEYYWFSDPMEGIVYYAKSDAEKCYNLLGKQAMLLQPVTAETTAGTKK